MPPNPTPPREKLKFSKKNPKIGQKRPEKPKHGTRAGAAAKKGQNIVGLFKF